MYNPIKPHKKETLDLVKKTWNTPYVSVTSAIYPIIKKKFHGKEVDHTDGIGTKGFFHWKKRTFKNAVLDALAMNLNDLALVRAIPYKLTDHITLPKEDNGVIHILKALSEECVKRKIAITGGETSFHDNSDSLDITINVSGFIKKHYKNRLKNGDVLVGIKSNGLHSNGFTAVRKVFKNANRQEFVQPTHIYLDLILKLNSKFAINGMMHMTGGSFAKLKDIMHGVDINIHRNHKLNPHPIFFEIFEKGISDGKMYTTFNCGIGFILSVPKSQAKQCLKSIKEFKADLIGEVVKGDGKIKIESMFSKKTIVL